MFCRRGTSTNSDGNRDSEPRYIDRLAKELASETCIRCSEPRGWKTAAMMYEGITWNFYYCYECRRWSIRHFRYRYAMAPLDDIQTISMLLRRLNSTSGMTDNQSRDASWLQRKISAASVFFQRFLP